MICLRILLVNQIPLLSVVWFLFCGLQIFLDKPFLLWYPLGNNVAQQMLRERSLMPPKVKFSKEAIIGTALQLVRRGNG